ncbi:hypothetical protein MNBD_UNCLBAC01-269 [hydrothermal vent metagenome]|uniref:Uncharacterized protein n=1 Tax=hydrothermal vent metagenome TaxID=652676 RepID=A0A3B1D2N9_9ZZZZ
MVIDKNKYREGVMVRTLNDLIPSSYAPLIAFSQNKNVHDKESLEGYIKYYQNIIKYHPHMAEAHGLLGFCYYHSGQYEEAIEMYQTAISLNKHFFWFSYNLGIVYLKIGQYEKAKDSFQQALLKKPEHALLFIKESKMIYLPILKAMVSQSDFSIPKQLKLGYQECQKILLITKKAINSSRRIPESLLNQIQLKVY